MTREQQRLRDTFDSAADLYQQARPEYPAQLYDTLIDTPGLDAGDRLVEVGCATGKATIPLARRGFHITCIEIGYGPLVTGLPANLPPTGWPPVLTAWLRNHDWSTHPALRCGNHC